MNQEQDPWQSKDDNTRSSGLRPYQPIGNDHVAAAEPLKQSGPGIASFIVGIISIFMFVISIVVIIGQAADLLSLEEAIEDSEAIAAMGVPFVIAGLLFLGSLILSFVGTILAIIGLVIKNRRKVFAIIGLILNGLFTIGFVLLVLIGIASQVSV
ncbi:hypothetical protein EBB07_03675 [Paenibacillaceae bacterium]|nr:hypothetical protein EBB07_03675 [Paenibacillaceae bacterium]